VEVTLGPIELNDLATEDILNNLATAYQSMGQYAKAEETYKQALNLGEIRLGSFHPDLATPLINLGSLYFNMKQYKHAEDHFLRAIAILEQPITAVDQDRLMEALHGLARTYIRKDEESRAEPVLRQASDIARRSLNQAILIPEILKVLDDYSIVLRDLHDPVAADRLHAEAQRIRAAAAFTVEAKPKPRLR